jgi:hypothetical protein
MEKASDGQRPTIRLNGPLQSEHLDELKMQGNGEQWPIALDLESVILVDDLNGERFLPSLRLKGELRHDEEIRGYLCGIAPLRRNDLG